MNEYQFNSKYSEYIKSYIEMMVSKGYKSYSFYYLKQFDDFLCANNYNEVTINKRTRKLILLRLITFAKNWLA